MNGDKQGRQGRWGFRDLKCSEVIWTTGDSCISLIYKPQGHQRASKVARCKMQPRGCLGVGVGWCWAGEDLGPVSEAPRQAQGVSTDGEEQSQPCFHFCVTLSNFLEPQFTHLYIGSPGVTWAKGPRELSPFLPARLLVPPLQS